MESNEKFINADSILNEKELDLISISSDEEKNDV